MTYHKNDQSNDYRLILKTKTFKEIFGIPYKSVSSELHKCKHLQVENEVNKRIFNI